LGNLGDITFRAVETLRSTHLIAAEDTRRTGNLLRHFGISTRMLSYHEHNKLRRTPAILQALTEGDVALVSDAGTPVVSDPGQELVRAAAAAGHDVVAVPGPSAPIAALSVSGLGASPFHFAGFLPRKTAARKTAIATASVWPGPLVLFEAPHRLRELLDDLLSGLGDRRLAVCCELTKFHESVLRTSLAGAVRFFQEQEPRGEYTLVVEGPPAMVRAAAGQSAARAPADDLDRFQQLVRETGDRRQALTALAAETGRPRKELYQAIIARPREQGHAP
jgi:16S rRNA (cytidine1402-2'-O)-methyltransferase